MSILAELPDKFNAAAWLVDRHIAEGRGEKTAIYYEDQVITYADVSREVNRVGNGLKKLGVRVEDRVLLLMFDCPEFVASFFGAMKIGAVPIPTNTLLKQHDYEYLLNDSRTRVAVVSEGLVDQIRAIRPRLEYLEHLVVVGQAGETELAYRDLVGSESTELAPAQTSKDDAAFWLYSSGTTGFPKGTVHLHHDMIVSSELYGQGVLGINEQDITFSVAKLFFAYGLGNALYFPFSVGAATVLYPNRPEPTGIFKVLNRYKPTLFFCVPTAYAGMLQFAENNDFGDLSSIQACVSAGEALPKAIFEAWKNNFNLIILDGIGSTEICHIFISNRIDDYKPGSSGKVVPGYEAKIVDENGQHLADGEIGTLWVKGDSIASCYWNKHEKTKETFLGSWINTSDKYYRDKDGYFWYIGRSDDMLKAGGIWVSPIEVENTIMEHPSVLECGVIGASDGDSLVKPKAYIKLKDGYTGSEELIKEIQQFVKTKIAPYKYPRWVEFVDEMPKTATGKIMRYVLRQKHIQAEENQ